MNPNSHINQSNVIRRHILLYSTFCSFLSGVLIAAVSVLPLYNSLRTNAKNDLLTIARIKATAVDEFLRRSKDIAAQIASRSVIADKHESYNKGSISREELESFCLPKLKNPFARAGYLAGLLRLDAKGHAVIGIGTAVDRAPRVPLDSRSNEVIINGVFEIDGKSFLCVSAPIVKGKSERIGTDIDLFKLEGLREIMGKARGVKQKGEFYLAAAGNDGPQSIFPPPSEKRDSKDTLKGASIDFLLARTFHKESGVREVGSSLKRPGIAAYRPLEDVPWGLAVWKNKTEVYSPTIRNVVFVCGWVVAVIVFGALGMVFVLSPLVGKMILQSEDLENEVRLKTAELERELSERRRAEEERFELQQRLQRMQKAESLARMGGAIAHHFNNLIGAVMGRLELAIFDLPEGSASGQDLFEAMEAAKRAAELSRSMLTYLGQDIEVSSPANLAGVCRESLPSLEALVPEQVRIRAEFTTEQMVHAHELRVRQVLENLVLNAAEAMGEREGEIVLSTCATPAAEIPASRIHPVAWKPKDNDYACILVSDTGIGMDAETLEKIFDPFFSTKFTGRGLGLAVALGIVTAYDGAIAVESSPGRGSVFKVFLPLCKEEPRAEPVRRATARDAHCHG